MHTCHATGCDQAVPPKMWGCRRHWFMVPRELRTSIWRHYRPGQEDDWQPSRAYLLAARDAVISVAKKEGLEPDTRVYDAFLSDLSGEESEGSHGPA